MQTTRLYARESVAFDHELVVRDTNGNPIDINGWDFEIDLQRRAGSSDLSLSTADAGSDRLEVTDGAAGALRFLISQSSLKAIPDTTGEYDLFGDLIGKPPVGTARFVADVRLNVTMAGESFLGPSYQVVVEAVGAAIFLRADAAADRSETAADASGAFANFKTGDLAAAEAATVEGERFSYADGGQVYAMLRTASGSDLLAEMLTRVSVEGSEGASRVGTARGMTVQRYLDTAPIPILGVGDGITDDRAAILAAIDAAFAQGGGVVTSDLPHAFSGRILMKPGVRIDMGVNGQTPSSPSGIAGPRLIALDNTGGIDLVAGSHIRATLRIGAGSEYIGPMLEISDAKSSLNFGRNERHCSFDVDIRGDRQDGSQGIRIISTTPSGVSWFKGVATVGEIDFPCTFETNGANTYVNEGWLDLWSYGSVYGLRAIRNGGAIDAHRIQLTTQTDAAGQAKRALLWDGGDSEIHIKVWDWKTGQVDPSAGGTPIELLGGGNNLYGSVSRSSGMGGEPRMPVIDRSPRSTTKNYIHINSGANVAAVNTARIMPASEYERTYAGDQDNCLAFADKRYTVTGSGATPPDAISLTRLFDLSSANLSVNNATDFTVLLDFGSTPTGMTAMGVSMVELPDRIRLQGSADNANWTTVMTAGYDNDPVPPHLFRDNGVPSYRYYRLQCGNDTPRRVLINRWWAVNLGFTRLPGAFLPFHDPSVTGSVKIANDSSGAGLWIGGQRVVRGQRGAISDAAGGDEVAKINAILGTLRQHGLIAP